MLSTQEMRTLLDSIEITKRTRPDRALIALMDYTFARVGAVVRIKVEDNYVQKRCCWFRFQKKGGKVTNSPATTTSSNFLTVA